jgi:hypothetical protein
MNGRFVNDAGTARRIGTVGQVFRGFFQEMADGCQQSLSSGIPGHGFFGKNAATGAGRVAVFSCSDFCHLKIQATVKRRRIFLKIAQ